MVLDSSSEFDQIKITIPKGLIFSDFINIEKCFSTESELLIEKLNSPNFFGLSVTQDDLFESTHISQKITISFVKDNHEIKNQILTANIYRPNVIIIKGPSAIELTEDSELHGLLWLDVQVEGFGNIDVMVEHRLGTKYEVDLESFYNELVRRFLHIMVESREVDDGGFDFKSLTDDIMAVWEQLLPDSFSKELKKDTLLDFQDRIKDDKFREYLKRMISQNIEEQMTNALLHYMDRFPADRVDLRFGKPSVPMVQEVDAIQLRIRYRDSAGNEYKPPEHSIDVHDSRKERIPIILPVEIKWEIQNLVLEEE
jgi:hypothetical protein